jgi:hypothetical protein
MKARSLVHILMAVLVAQSSFAQILVDDTDLGTGPRPPRNRGVTLPGGPTIVDDLTPGGTDPNNPGGIGIITDPFPPIDPTKPTQPSQPPSLPSGNGMTGVVNSMVPGLSCPLIDNRPYADLVAAVNGLYAAINPTPDCETDANLQQATKQVQQMLANAKIAQNYWNSPNAMQIKPGAKPGDADSIAPEFMDENLVIYGDAVNATVGNLNAILNSLSNSAFVKKECAQELLSTTGVVKALGDVATSLAPMAMLAAAANPLNKPLLGVVLGVSTFGSLAQFIDQVFKAGVMDMKKPENRLIVLQNTCEFAKIEDRVRYLKMAQSGQIKEVTDELNSKSTRAMDNLTGTMSPRLSQIKLIRDNFKKELTDATRQLKQDSIDFRNEISLKAKQFDKDNFQMCNLADTLVESLVPGEFPATIMENYLKLHTNQTKRSTGQSILVNAEKKSREALNKLRESNTLSTTKCAEYARSYITTLQAVMKDTQATIRAQLNLLRQKVAQDPEGGPFQEKEDKVIQDSEDMQKILSVLELLKQDNAAPDKSEMAAQLNILKQALFGDVPGFLPRFTGYGNTSPALGWLVYMDEQGKLALQRMDAEWNNVRKKACEMTKSKCIMPMPPKSEGTMPDYYFKQVSQYTADIKLVSDLSNISAKMPAPNTPQNTDTCRVLQSAWFEWTSVFDFLGAQGLYCKVVEPLFNDTVQKKLVSHCVDNRRIDGLVQKPSVITARLEQLKTKGYLKRAEIISKKMDELECNVPGSFDEEF